jgi:hypothetical protein
LLVDLDDEVGAGGDELQAWSGRGVGPGAEADVAVPEWTRPGAAARRWSAGSGFRSVAGDRPAGVLGAVAAGALGAEVPRGCGAVRVRGLVVVVAQPGWLGAADAGAGLVAQVDQPAQPSARVVARLDGVGELERREELDQSRVDVGWAGLR